MTISLKCLQECGGLFAVLAVDMCTVNMQHVMMPVKQPDTMSLSQHLSYEYKRITLLLELATVCMVDSRAG